MGLEAQQAAVASFLKGDRPQADYIEVESGKKNQRPQLLAAMAAVRAADGVLLIAKLDRLSRNASFILTRRDAGVNFVCRDTPHIMGLFAVLAQHERETIFERTKEAFAAKKARGAQLGTPANLTAAAREQRLLVRQVAALVASRRAQGVSFRQLARELNTLGFTAPRGGTFNQKQV